MRPLPFLAGILALGLHAEARADDAHGVDDPRFARSLRAGILHTDDETFEATWYRPATLEASAWILRSPRRFLDGLQVYGSLGAESVDVVYRQRPSDYQEGLVGIHRADIDVERGPVFGAGLRASLYDDGRFRLSGFADLAFQIGTSDVGVDALLIDLEGLKIDVAKAVHENASVSYAGRAYRLGITGAASFRAGSLRWTPYMTLGWLDYRGEIGFETNARLEEALMDFGVDAAVLSDRVVVESNVFFAPGVRLDLSRAWSLETQALIGRYDGTWVAAGTIGAAWRFGR
jgi:hypothetical protein